MEINRNKAIAEDANRTAQERMAAEQRVFDLEQQLQKAREAAFDKWNKKTAEYVEKKYGKGASKRAYTESEWARLTEEAFDEDERRIRTLQGQSALTASEREELSRLNRERAEYRKTTRSVGTAREVYQTEAAGQEGGLTETQKRAAAGKGPAASAVRDVASALGLSKLPETATEAFTKVATSYAELLSKMEEMSATAGARITTLLYEGFIGRLKKDLLDEVNRS
jgi:ribonucleotide reductase alpha subunit